MGTIGDKVNNLCCDGKKLRDVNKLSHEESNLKI